MRGGVELGVKKILIRQYLLKLAFSARLVVQGSEAYEAHSSNTASSQL